MNSYRTTVHIRCPFQPVWDYYTVELNSEQMVQCETFEVCCDVVRSREISQEETAAILYAELVSIIGNKKFVLTVTGRHGANCETVVML